MSFAIRDPKETQSHLGWTRIATPVTHFVVVVVVAAAAVVVAAAVDSFHSLMDPIAQRGFVQSLDFLEAYLSRGFGESRDQPWLEVPPERKWLVCWSHFLGCCCLQLGLPMCSTKQHDYPEDLGDSAAAAAAAAAAVWVAGMQVAELGIAVVVGLVAAVELDVVVAVAVAVQVAAVAAAAAPEIP